MENKSPSENKISSFASIFEQFFETLYNGKKTTWQGPQRCLLCKNDEETIGHLLVYYSYTKDVWDKALKLGDGR
jgi:hypothetical protein